MTTRALANCGRKRGDRRVRLIGAGVLLALACSRPPSSLALTEPTAPAVQPARPEADAHVDEPARAEPVTLSIVATNDVHGRLEQLPLFGGYVSNLRAARAHDAGAVLLLDAGDMFQGTLASNLTEGAAMVRGYNALGYNAAAVGNHEFDFGPAGPHPLPVSSDEDSLGALRQRAAEARFPLLCANAREKRGGAFPIPAIGPSTLITQLGMQIGIIGGITKDALTQTQSANVAGLTIEPLADSVTRESQALRARGARLVIAVVHAGGDCADLEHPDDLSTCERDAEAFALARALPAGAVDLIVGGHTHAGVAHHVNGVPIIESLSNGRAFGRVDFSLDRASGRVLSHRIFAPHRLCADALDKPQCADEAYEGRAVKRDADVRAAIALDLANASQEQARPIGVVLKTDVKRSHDAESALGNLVADLLHRAFHKADAAINNGGSVRVSLPAGPLTYGQLFEMFPFDNAFATVHMPARVLADIVAKNLQSERGFLALSGLRAAAHCDGEKLVVDLRRDNGKPIAPDTMLEVVMSDFLASGGDELLRGLPIADDAIQIHRDQMLRDALVRGFASYRGGRVDGDARSIFDPAHPRVRYAGTRPLHCPARPAQP